MKFLLDTNIFIPLEPSASGEVAIAFSDGIA